MLGAPVGLAVGDSVGGKVGLTLGFALGASVGAGLVPVRMFGLASQSTTEKLTFCFRSLLPSGNALKV